MKSTTTISAIAAIAPVILAAPVSNASVPQTAQAYQPYALTNSSSELLPVVASGGSFWIGKSAPTLEVPSWASNPEAYNKTIITGPTGGDSWWMGVLHPQGQQILLSYGNIVYARATDTVGGTYLNGHQNTDPRFDIEKMDDGRLKLVNAVGHVALGEDLPESRDWFVCYTVDAEGQSTATLEHPGVMGQVVAGSTREWQTICKNFQMVLVPTDAPAPVRYLSFED